MEDNGSAVRIEKLSDSNYHAWKQIIILVLTLRDLDYYLTEDPSGKEDEQMNRKWNRGDRKAQAIIGLVMSDEDLELMRNAESAKDMWKKINNVFERHTLLNRPTARRRFYTVSM